MGLSSLSIRNRIMPLFLAAAVLLPSSLLAQEKLQIGGGSAPAAAADEPVAVITLGSIGKLIQDANYITGAAGQPGAGGMFQMAAATFTNGIDSTRPIGMIVPMVNGMPDPIVVIPTSDIKRVLKTLEAQLGPVDELDDGTLVIAVNANTVYIRQTADWAFASRTRDTLNLAPGDPTTLFKGMGNNYDLAFRIRMQQIPPETRNMIVAQMRQGFEQAMANQEDEAGREMAENSIDQMEMVLKESDKIDFGLNIDSTLQQILLDFTFTVVPGSKLASIYGEQQAIPSKFASVIRKDAAAYFHAATAVSQEAIQTARDRLENTLSTVRTAMANEADLPAEQQAEINKFIDRIANFYVDSLAEGKLDMGAMLLADQNEFRFAMGGFVADGSEAAQIAKDIAAKIENEPGAPTFKFDQGNYNGVTMHVIEKEVPAGEEQVRKVFGDVLRVHIGTGEKAVYVAAGKDSETLVKNLIDAGTEDPSFAQRPVSQMRVTMLPILKFAQSMDDNAAIAGMINALSGAVDPGEITMVGQAIPNGSKTRITIGEGLIKAIGAAAEQARGGGGQF